MKTILLHGLGQTAASWNETVRNLAGECCCPDLPALLAGEPAEYNTLYHALEAYCAAFDEPVNLCGLSLGAVLALQYGIEHPERINKLVLIAPQYAMPTRLLRIQNIIFSLMPSVAFAGTGFKKHDFILLCSSMAKLDFTAALPQMRCRTLVLCGARDKANKLAAYRLRSLLPNAELSILPDAGHEINREAPAVLARRLNKFFD